MSDAAIAAIITGVVLLSIFFVELGIFVITRRREARLIADQRNGFSWKDRALEHGERMLAAEREAFKIRAGKP